MSYLQNTKQHIDDFFARKNTLNAENFAELGPVLNPENARGLLREVLVDPKLMARIAAQSHRHSQGFGKIVLIDDREGAGYKLRFHTWDHDVKKGASPITEDKHEHRWDFASVVLTGHMENQRYQIRDLTPEERGIWDHFEEKMRHKSLAEVSAIIARLDQLEAIAMASVSEMAKAMGGVEKLQGQADKASLMKELELNENQLGHLTHILFKYSNARDKKTGREIYTPQGPRAFDLVDVQHYQPNTLYFHPVELAHRLFLDATRERICTLLITGPVYPERKPGEFVRSTAGRDQIAIRERASYQSEELRCILEDWVSHLNKG